MMPVTCPMLLTERSFQPSERAAKWSPTPWSQFVVAPATNRAEPVTRRSVLCGFQPGGQCRKAQGNGEPEMNGTLDDGGKVHGDKVPRRFR